MAWHYGIPDFIGNYVYFESLNETSQNTPSAARWKRQLYQKAQKSVAIGIGSLTDTSKIKQANTFLSSVANNERSKELDMVRSFCDKTKTTFPALEPYLKNPELVYKDPEKFYTELTNAINRIRKGTKEYLTELKRIEKNIAEKGRTLENYKEDDYRYRLNGDISSFLNRLRGNFKDIADVKENQYALQIQNTVMHILSSTGFLNQISDGVSFAAIASALLVELEQQVQKEIDKNMDKENQNKDLASIIETDFLPEIEKRYIRQINQRDKLMGPVQRAIADIGSLDFTRIVQNSKELLGLKSLDLNTDALKKNADKIRKRDSRVKNDWIKNIRNTLGANKALKKNLNLLEFSISGSVNTQHGSINEYIGSIFDNGRNVNGKGAIDILTATISWEAGINNQAMDFLLNDMSTAITESTFDDPTIGASVKDTREQLATMNEKIREAIRVAEKQIRGLEDMNLDQIFVYHETLKLYSSMETGRNPHNSFGGREMGILKYIDYMASSAVSSDSALVASRDELAFLGLNLMSGTIGAEARGPLEKYFSMYAGMLMFDDVTNMALEVVNSVSGNNSKTNNGITQIHLYNLNGVYVPASMLLTYVADTVNGAGAIVDSGLAAQAHISVPKTNDAYNAWLARKQDGDGRLYPDDWRAVANEQATNTKVSITFMASFLKFIQNLGQL